MASPHADLLTAKSGRVKAARRLARRSSRTESRLFLAEGDKALTEAIGLPGVVVEVFATLAATMQAEQLRARVVAADVPWRLATDEAVASLSGAVTPQGIVAVCRHLDLRFADALAESEAGPLVICADVRDPGNAGTIIRTADAVGARAVVLAGDSVDLYNDKTVRATVGSLFHIPVVLAPDATAAVAEAKRAGFVVLAADGAGERDLFGADELLAGQVAWLFGNEARGLPEDLAALADHRVSIPIVGGAESLNLATAAAVCLYATLRVGGWPLVAPAPTLEG